MSNLKLNKEEKEILEAFDIGRLQQVENVEKEKTRYQQSARHTLSKAKNINIRISEKDLQNIKALAAEKGLPYQTFISALLHQYTSRKTKEPVSR
jgi:predicted DNA binding CopG/RHH family protein